MIRFNYRGYKVQIERWRGRFGIVIEGVRAGTSLIFSGAVARAVEDIDWYISTTPKPNTN